MSGLKIVVIGGGSSYTPELIEGLLNRYHEMPVASLWLVDIEEGKEKVEIIAGLARRMIAKAGLTIEVVPPLTGKARCAMPISSARSFAPAALTPGSAMNVSPSSMA